MGTSKEIVHVPKGLTKNTQQLVHNTTDLVRQFLIARSEYLWRLMDDPRKDINAECGYPYIPTVFMYREWYDREGIATRVNNIYPDECWSVHPKLCENEEQERTDFETAWDELVAQPDLNPWTYLHRADQLSGIGAYGILLFGLDDGGELAEPVPGILPDGTRDPRYKKNHKLIYLRAFDQTLVQVQSYEQDRSSPRYGRPLYYYVKFTDPLLLSASVQPALLDYTVKTVHWSRILHLADNRMSSEVFGVPRMQPVLNRLFDLRKMLGGSGEGYWRAAQPGYAFKTPPELGTNVNLDLASLEQQMSAWANNLQRYIAVTGMDVTSLAPTMISPTPFVEECYKAICATIKTPLKVFLGSESGHLASQEDARSWNRRLRGRQRMYIDPYVIYPFVTRLIAFGVLPKPKKFFTEWDDLASLTDEEKANVSLKKSQALFQYVSGKIESCFPLREFLTLVMGYSIDQAEAIAKEVETNKTLVTEKTWDLISPNVDGPPGGNQTGKGGKSPGRRRTTSASSKMK